MATQNQKIHGIIHTASAACAAVGAGLAQVPGSDAAAIVPIQTTMLTGIAYEHGVSLTRQMAAEFLLTFVATQAGRFISQVLVGWIPGLGNAINASTAAALTEAVGWAANAYFDEADHRAGARHDSDEPGPATRLPRPERAPRQIVDALRRGAPGWTGRVGRRLSTDTGRA